MLEADREGSGRGGEWLPRSLPVGRSLALTQKDWPFDENLISKSTAGTGCMHPTGRLLTALPAYRSHHVALSAEEREEVKDGRKEGGTQCMER